MEDIFTEERLNALKGMENNPNIDRRLVIFADYGLDDACATLYLLGNRDKYDFIDVIPVGGNVQAERAIINIRNLLSEAHSSGMNLDGVRIVDCTERYQKFCALPSIHGRDGMGDVISGERKSPVPEIAYEDWLSSVGEGYEILSLGPCTMVRDALAYSKSAPGGKILVMGGCVREVPNYNGREFNDGLDHAAFLCVIRRPHLAATLDTCRVPAFNLAGSRKTGRSLLDKFVNRSIELAEARHPDNCYIYDYIAAFALVHPEMFEAVDELRIEIMRKMHVLRLKEEFARRKDLL